MKAAHFRRNSWTSSSDGSSNAGDKIVTEREIHPPELAFKFPAAVRTITDVVCQHSTQTGETVFLYELDGRGPLVRLEAPPRKKRK